MSGCDRNGPDAVEKAISLGAVGKAIDLWERSAGRHVLLCCGGEEELLGSTYDVLAELGRLNFWQPPAAHWACVWKAG